MCVHMSHKFVLNNLETWRKVHLQLSRGAALEAGIFGSVKLGRPRLTSPPLRQIHAAQLGDRFLQLMEEAGDMGKPHGQPWVRRATRKVDADEAMVSAVHGGTGCAPAGVATASGNEMTET